MQPKTFSQWKKEGCRQGSPASHPFKLGVLAGKKGRKEKKGGGERYVAKGTEGGKGGECEREGDGRKKRGDDIAKARTEEGDIINEAGESKEAGDVTGGRAERPFGVPESRSSELSSHCHSMFLLVSSFAPHVIFKLSSTYPWINHWITTLAYSNGIIFKLSSHYSSLSLMSKSRPSKPHRPMPINLWHSLFFSCPTFLHSAML